MKNRKLLLIISLGIVLLAAAAAVVILLIQEAEAGSITVTSVDISPMPSPAQSIEPVQSTEPEEVLPPVTAPLLYTKDGNCYLASGANSICLGEFKNPAGKSDFPKTSLSGNKRYMFYLDGFDIYKGFGTLIRAAADALSEPVIVAENVCAAVPSNGGTRALYITDIIDSCGKLYLWDEKDGSKFIADNVLPEKLSNNYDYMGLTEQSVSDETSVFLLEEKRNETPADMTVNMYEATISGQKEFIAAAEYGGLWSPNNKCVAYEREEYFFVSRKTDKGWKEESLCKVIYDEEGNSPIWSEFDGTGTYLYYYNDEIDGSLYRYSSEDGAVKEVINNVIDLFIFRDTPYIINSKGNAYRVNKDGSAELMRKKIKGIFETIGGVYLTDEESGGNIYFVADGTAQSKHIGSCEDISSPGETIEYNVPFGDDKDKAVDILYDDLEYYLSKIEGYNGYDPYLTLEEDIALAEKLLGRTDLEPEEIDYLTKMLEGFRLYEQWVAGDSDKKAEAGNALDAAIEAYGSYVFGWGQEDDGCDD